MIEKALKYLMGLNAPNVQEIEGETYTDKPLNRISYNPKAAAIELNTLTSLVDYIKANVDIMPGNMIIHIQSPTRIQLYSPLDCEKKREYFVEVNALIPSFPMDQFIEHERFCINLQSKFIDVLDRSLLLKFAGTVESGSVAEYGDDGISQKATVRTGIATKSEALVPSPVRLVPYRTFIEVSQPTSEFIFRMKEGNGGICCALFESDGGAWKIHAMNNIKAYLEEQLKDVEGFVIIS